MKTTLTNDKRENVNETSGANNPAVQPKLTVGQANDKYEQEADTMADKVSRGDQPFTQQKGITTVDAGAGTVQAGDAVSDKIKSSAGSGNSLDSDTRSFMETQLGADFSHVKVHTDGEAVQMNRDLDAKAFTTGKDIYFNEGQYKPGEKSGKQLLAHELTHVVQQGGDAQQVQRTVTETDEQTPGDKEKDMCEGWESDLESLTIDAARFHFRTEHGEDVHVDKMDCVSGTSEKMKVCKITLTDGRQVRVVYNPKLNIIRVEHTEGGVTKFCKYSYTCAYTGGVTYTKLECNE